MDDVTLSVTGQLTVRRGRPAGWPAWVLHTDEGLQVKLGAYSAVSVYFGWGQRVELPDGSRWRVLSLDHHSRLRPVLVDETRGGKLAMAAAGVGNYGISGSDYAYILNPAEVRIGRASCWDLFRGDEERDERVAGFHKHPFGGVCERPVPLPAVLLSLLLTRLSIPGEHETHVPQDRWALPA